MFTTFILQILTLTLPLITLGSVTVPINSKFGHYYISLSLDKQHAQLELPINLCSQYPIISSNSFKISPNAQSSQLKFPYLNSKVDLETVYLNKDNVNISPKVNLKSYPYYYLKYYTNNFNTNLESLPFAYKFNDESFSLTHQLYKKKLISRLSFSLVNMNTAQKSLVFGKPPSIIDTKKESANLNVKSQYNTWGSDLSYIFIDRVSYLSKNTYYKNKYYSFFDTGISGMLVPTDFYNFLMENVFKKYIETKQCGNVLFSEQFYFVCDNDVVDKIPDLIFVFENKGLRIKSKYLFSKMGQNSDFLISKNTVMENTFILGTSFISEFDTIFDYENNKISFFSNTQIEKINLDILFPLRRVIQVLTISILFFISLFAYKYIKKYMKRRKHNKIKERFLAFKIEGDFAII